jgi:hypothetical protein
MIIATKPMPYSAGITPPNVDRKLQPIRFFFFSGNHCTVTPSMRLQGGEKCTIVLGFDWKREPTDDDKREMEEEMNSMVGQPPEVQYRAETRAARPRRWPNSFTRSASRAKPDDARRRSRADGANDQREVPADSREHCSPLCRQYAHAAMVRRRAVYSAADFHQTRGIASGVGSAV